MAKIEAPEEVQNQISERLKESGFLDSMNKKVLEALNQAARAISTKSNLPESLWTKPMSILDKKDEMVALQSIYQYLKANGLNYTLSTLISETTVNIDEKLPKIDILEIFKAQQEEEDAGFDDGFNVESDNEPAVEKPVEKTPSPHKIESVAPISLQDEFGSNSTSSNQELSINDSDDSDIPIEDSEGSDIPVEESDDFNISDDNDEKPKEEEKKTEPSPTGNAPTFSHHEIEPPVPISKFDFERIPLRISVNLL